MTGPRKKEGDSEGDSGFVTPDSTTREKVAHFSEGEDVLSHGKDGLYYLGTIVVVNIENGRCLVHFEDNTAHWSLFKDITKLRIPESDELCANCKSSRSTKNNEIVLCSLCDQGYHQNCIQPSISVEFCEGEGRWVCPRCEASPSIDKEEKNKHSDSSPKKQRKSTNECPDEHGKRLLPYKLSALTWEIGHKINKEQTYCYCGGPGEWYNKMIQCNRCRQWFHEACIDCLHFPLLYGDRYFVFICALCNEGCEFLHRLEVKWLDIIHLSLFNLSLADTNPYFDYNSNITQWITDNWESLQCPLALQNVCVRDRKHVVFRVLNNNKSRFKCSKMAKMRRSHWRLSASVPPPVMSVELPNDVPITYDIVKNAVMSYNKQRSSSPPIKRTIRDRFDETGNALNGFTAAKKHPTPSCDSSPQNSDEYPNRRKRKREIERLLEDNEGKTLIEHARSHTPKMVEEPPVKKKRGRRCKGNSKKCTPNTEFKKRLLRDKENSYVLLKGTEQYGSIINAGTENGLCDTSGDETSSHGTLDSFIPTPSNFDGPNNPFSTMNRPVNVTKKKLNANDIRIGKNGEVKRRRFRRKAIQNNCVQIRNCFEYALNGRSEKRGPATFSEIQSTVNTYFGASKRIEDGEKFRILAKRLDSDGHCQYLVEWGIQS